MGSTSGAFISHLQFNINNCCCFERLRSIRTQLNSVQAHNPRRPRLRLRSRRSSRTAVCFAVDDLREKQQELASEGSGIGSALEDRPDVGDSSREETLETFEQNNEGNALYNFLYPSKELLPDDKEMSIFDHLEELRQRIFVSVLAVGAAILGCFAFSKELIFVLEAPVKAQGVRFLQLAPGEFFFTTLKVSGYCGLLVGSPIILYEIIAFVLPGLTKAERRFLAPIVLGSSVLFYAGITFSYLVLTPAALNFFVSYAEGAVESLWSIDQYFEFVLVLMFSTGLSFQVPVIQFLLGQVGLVSGDQMLSIWRYVVVGAVVVAAVLTPSTDPLTQMLLATPLLGLYLGGAWVVKLTGR
ncbi:sec-independent protein translocase protein TATC, chloroplastic [Ziziphus jujuba]|uniref:Sec-independent protein translocase protein TATC, chloroplastic n=1 Tax=Ziziphus jujuba TaxID=326968 RepID=A0A6P4B1A8_ZIZJJ|nr:sec-independent protein translocase protein TATC, chloroplastic [Ziziphus jujuba]